VLTTAGVVLLSYGYLERRESHPHDYYTLLLLATLGGATLVASTHFASFFLGLEVLSVSLYTLIAYPRLHADFIEAGVKYLVLAAATAAFLLFGMALVYAELGTMSLNGFALLHVTGGGAADTSLLVGGFVLIIVGIGFKLGVVPFHMWTPDIYQGAPAPVTAFVATVSKGAMVALLLRYFRGVSLNPHDTVWIVFAAIAAASMIAGNLLALLQSNVKRLLAYSSIAHAGYLLVAFTAIRDSSAGISAAMFYSASYAAMNVGAFAVVSHFAGAGEKYVNVDDYAGLGRRSPLLAAALTVFLLSLIGIPITGGFFAKFYVFTAALQSSLVGLTIIGVINSAIGAYYYLRLIVLMYMREPQSDAPVPPIPFAAGLAMVLSLIATIYLGVLPGPVLNFALGAARELVR
jgi:NADH-quinone oxidoreductase subunit N